MADIKQIRFDEQQDILPNNVQLPHAQHLACILLVDTSGSMAGESIKRLNEAINEFKEQTMLDEIARNSVDIAIVEFNSYATVIQDFVPLPEMQTVTLNPRGVTSMGAGIELAIDMVKARTRLYASLGTPSYKPWIIMITDGAPTDDITVAKQRIEEEENKGSYGKLKFWAIGVPGFDVNTLTTLSRRCISIDKARFKGLFNWLSESMVAISSSSVNENIALPPIKPQEGENIAVIPTNW